MKYAVAVLQVRFPTQTPYPDPDERENAARAAFSDACNIYDYRAYDLTVDDLKFVRHLP